MPEQTYKVEPFGVEYICDECGKSEMNYLKMTDDPIFGELHECNCCGHQKVFYERYPVIRYRRKGKESMEYKYPSKQEIDADFANETTAINVAITALHEALDACPLSNHVKIYAICELALKMGDSDYVREVIEEIIALRNFKRPQNEN